MAPSLARHPNVRLFARCRRVRRVVPFGSSAAALLQAIVEALLSFRVVWFRNGVAGRKRQCHCDDSCDSNHRPSLLAGWKRFGDLLQANEAVLVVGTHPVIHHLGEVAA